VKLRLSESNNYAEYYQSEPFKSLAKVLEENNQNGFLVGGLVRDLLLNRPCKDIDIVVEGSGLRLAEELAKELDCSKVSYFKNFGTAHFVYKDLDVEFVGARKESYQRNSRNPVVEEGSIEDDQKRRDFTINALAISMNKSDFGNLVDPFDGVEDLKNGILRTPLDPDTTYSDDPLRMMRAARFASQLNFEIEKESFDSITRNAERIDIISQERITEELNKIMLSPKPSKGFLILFKTGILERIFPELTALHGVDERNGIRHKDNFFHTLQVIDQLAEKSEKLFLRWAALLHDIAKPPTKRFDTKAGWTFHGHEDKGARMVPSIFKRMRLPMDAKMKYVQKLVALHLRPIALTKDGATDSGIRRLIVESGEDLDDLMLLCESDITSKNKEKVKRYLSRFKSLRERVDEVAERDEIRNWQPPIDGKEIISTFKMKPSKEVGVIKDAIKNAILDGVIENSYEAAYDFMLEKAKELGIEKEE
jgi:putative nucleotidyltransferase with HDIG domain